MKLQITDDEQARLHTAHLMAEYLLSLSHVCRTYNWHRTGLHVYAAGEELKKMLRRNRMTQNRYVKKSA